jgi:hypothetical protein
MSAAYERVLRARKLPDGGILTITRVEMVPSFDPKRDRRPLGKYALFSLDILREDGSSVPAVPNGTSLNTPWQLLRDFRDSPSCPGPITALERVDVRQFDWTYEQGRETRLGRGSSPSD